MKTMYAVLALVAFQFAAAQKTIDIKDFTVLAVSGGVEITLVPSSENKLVIEEGNPDELDVATEEGALAISADRDDYRLTIHFKGNIEEIAVSGGVEIKGRGKIKGKKMSINIAAGSEIHLDVEADQIKSAAASGSEMHLSGTSNRFEAAVASGAELDGAGLKTENSLIVVASGGEASIHASGVVDATVASGGELNIHGNPKTVNKVVANGGEVNMMN
jgi:hypothetical protein